MSDCCERRERCGSHPKKYPCPVNGLQYGAVGRKTILHHVLHPWQVSLADQGYYFCTDPDCHVVYFGEDGAILSKDELRTAIWQKQGTSDSEVCYCFGVKRSEVKQGRGIRKFILQMTRDAMCSCETSNPSGRCCLKDLFG